MKTLKKFVGLTLGLMFSLCFCAFTACGGGDNSSSNNGNDNVTAYTFIVKNADGSNVADGYFVQLCTADNSSCDMPIAIVDGKAVYTSPNITEPGSYEVHVLSSDYNQVELKEHYMTNSEKFETYTIYLN